MLALVAIMLSFLFVLYATSEISDFKGQVGGFILLVLSACFQSLEVAIENRIFLIEKDLWALVLQQTISIWKMILLVCVLFIGHIFPSSIGMTLGCDTASISTALGKLNESKELYWLMLGLLFFNALAANLGMQIVKAENAVFKQSVVLLSIPILWLWNIFFGTQKDKISYLEMLS